MWKFFKTAVFHPKHVAFLAGNSSKNTFHNSTHPKKHKKTQQTVLIQKTWQNPNHS